MRAVAEGYPSVCAVVVTYHPPPALLSNLKLLTQQVEAVVVVDNGSEPVESGLLVAAERDLGARVIRNERNLGIAAALNTGIKWAMSSGYEWVITFDQDSQVGDRFIASLIEAYEASPMRQRAALVAPGHSYPEDSDRKRAGLPTGALSQPIHVAMTSGSLIRTDVFGRVGFYNEPWFIDYVDFEFCLRLRAAGYQILRANRVQLQHRLGSPEAHSFLGWRVYIKSHSAWRRYYIMRNRLLMYRQYASRFPGWCLRDFGWLFLDLAKITVFESGKAAKLRMVLKGLGHGLAGKTGSLVLPPP